MQPSFPTFKSAAALAKVLAQRTGRAVEIYQLGQEWRVAYDYPDDDGEEDRYWLELREAVAAARAELRTELIGDADAWARSEEEGWFYGDDD